MPRLPVIRRTRNTTPKYCFWGYFSGFETEFQRPANRLRPTFGPLFGRVSGDLAVLS